MKSSFVILYPLIILHILIVKSVLGRSLNNHDESNVATGPADGMATEKVERTKRDIYGADDYEEYDYSDVGLVPKEGNNIVDSLNLPPGLNIGSGNKTLRLTDNRRQQAPGYMMDLYNQFTTQHLSHPSSNIVRSFMNINLEGK